MAEVNTDNITHFRLWSSEEGATCLDFSSQIYTLRQLSQGLEYDIQGACANADVVNCKLSFANTANECQRNTANFRKRIML